jgi:excinuclease ABC subunit A
VYEKQIAHRLLLKLTIDCPLTEVGLDYLTLNRNSSTLFWESQRINLATSLGSSLVLPYILDEPSIGLHPKIRRLIKVLLSLRDIGNTVIVVEHDEDIMKLLI